MVEKELHDLIKHIQIRGCEGQTTEVKAAHQECPEKLYDTISAFSNQNSGGTFVFGLDEERVCKSRCVRCAGSGAQGHGVLRTDDPGGSPSVYRGG